MAITIGSNIAALRTLRSLGDSTSAFTRSIERLGSGARINRAADDPAGLSAASILNTKARVLSRAKQNLGDGISALNVADGALSQVAALLQRMAELAGQAANGTFGAAQRRSLDQEYAQLDQEIRRIGETTSFNGISLLAGRKSSRAARVVAQDQSGAGIVMGGISGDGRYIARFESEDSGVSYDTLVVSDSLTGTSRTFTGLGIFTPTRTAVLANGDVITNTGDGLSRLNFESGNQSVILATGASSFDVSADGSTLAFYSGTWYADGGTTSSVIGSGYGRVYSMSLESGVIREITRTDLGADLFWGVHVSSDGSYVGFSTFTAVGFIGRGYVADVRGSGQINASSFSNSGATIGIAVTNDGRLISHGNSSLYSFDSSSGVNRTVVSNFTTVSFNARGQRLSADGQYLYFISDDNLTGENSGGAIQAFRVDVGTGRYTQLSQFTSELSGYQDDFVRFSADGSRMISAYGDLFEYDLTPESRNFDFEVGYSSQGGIIASVEGILNSVKGLGALRLTTQLSARAALDRMTDNIAKLSTARGVIGASLSRINSAYQISDTLAEMSRAAEGRIRDADIASESANAVRTSILQRVGATLLGQANLQPQIALRLLES